MDTASHTLFGSTLGILAANVPAIAHNPELQIAVLISTIVGSNAPDFDIIVRLKGKENYLKYHRGVTHSLPALFIWPFVISLPLMAICDLWSSFFPLWIFTFMAVVFHVLLDWFNAYGVQCFRPFTTKWQHLDVLPIVDPFLFGIHTLGLGICLFDWNAGPPIFLIIYGVTLCYLGIRVWAHQRVIKLIRNHTQITGEYLAIPSLHWFKWQFIIETDTQYFTGFTNYRKIEVKDEYQKDFHNEVIEASKGVDGVRTFLTFASKIHVKLTKVQEGYEVQWRDIRFWYNSNLPYGINVTLDDQLNITQSKIGWTKKTWDPPYI